MPLNLLARAKSKFKSFINLRSTSSIIKDESKFLVAQLESSGMITDEEVLHYSIISMKDKYPKFEKALKFPLAAKEYTLPSSTCNGLVLVFVRERYGRPTREALWNPTTSEFKTLPPAPSSFDNRYLKMSQGYFGFGFDSASEDYKVIRLLKRKTEHCYAPQAVMAELYSLTTDSWKQFSLVHPCIPRNPGVHVNGTYYWLTLFYPCFIMSFDFATEKFASSLIPAPPSEELNTRNAYHDNIKLVEYCGLLGAMVISSLDRWPSSLEALRSLEIWVWDGSWSLVSTLTVPYAVDLKSLVGTEKLIYLGLKKLMLFDCATSKLEESSQIKHPDGTITFFT
ncbi:Unknown protein [Striga hermonthica]|uniref:F-box associated beta-propeller type 1 domain-containing protein n=1 Tax=Striga hermonthica TaxID=68872 RepID=A0A9N7NA36_STRHE|nr:Unknown protein [Striga hermonthica]